MGCSGSTPEPEPLFTQGPIDPDTWANGEWLAATAEGDVIIWNAVSDRLGNPHLAHRCTPGKPTPPKKIVEHGYRSYDYHRSGRHETCGRSMMLKCRHPDHKVLTCAAVAFSQDGAMLAAAYKDTYLPSALYTLPPTTSSRREVVIWEPRTGSALLKMAWTRGEARESFVSLAFSPDSTLLAGTLGGPQLATCIALWSPSDGALLRTLEAPSSLPLPPPLRTDEGLKIATDGIDDGQPKWFFMGSHAVAFSVDGALLAWACRMAVTLWDPASGALLRLLEAHTAWVCGVAFSPTDSTTLASSSSDGTVRLWDAASGAARCTLSDPGMYYEYINVGKWRGRTKCFQALAFSSDGATLASGSEDMDGDRTSPYIRLWDVATGQKIEWVDEGAAQGAPMTKREQAWQCIHGKAVMALSFAVNDTMLISGGMAMHHNGGPEMWDTTALAVQASPQPPQEVCRGLRHARAFKGISDNRMMGGTYSSTNEKINQQLKEDRRERAYGITYSLAVCKPAKKAHDHNSSAAAVAGGGGASSWRGNVIEARQVAVTVAVAAEEAAEVSPTVRSPTAKRELTEEQAAQRQAAAERRKAESERLKTERGQSRGSAV